MHLKASVSIHNAKARSLDMFWMTTLLGMLLIGSLEMTGSDPDPEDDGSRPRGTENSRSARTEISFNPQE